MRRQSKKRQRLMTTLKPLRNMFRLEKDWMCAVCGWEYKRKGLPLDIHEIARGGSRNRAIKERTTWLLLCREHHELMDSPEWTVERQVALKLRFDGEYVDRELFEDIYGKKLNWDEVLECLTEFGMS